ncbi:MAG: sugar phosphate isomerase/epimerase family protein [Candidatus Coproplasma sp.]
MKVGISTASLFPRYATEEALGTIKSLGIDLAEAFFSTFYEYRPEFSKAIAPELGGLEINSVHANSTNFEPNFFNPTRRVKGDGFYWLDQLARSAQLLKCKNYTFHGMHRLSGGQGDDFDSLGGYLRDACEFAASYGVSLCLENVHWCLYNRPGVFAELKKRVPTLRGVFDIKQARRSHYPYQSYIKDMSGAIAYAHFSDVDENGKMCLPGKGIYNFTEIISQLKGEGFDGNILIEVYSGDYGEIAELKESADYLSEIIYKLG